MPRLTGAFFQSLDGVIQGPGAPMEDPSGGFRFGGLEFGDVEFVETDQFRAFVVGRQTAGAQAEHEIDAPGRRLATLFDRPLGQRAGGFDVLRVIHQQQHLQRRVRTLAAHAA